MQKSNSQIVNRDGKGDLPKKGWEKDINHTSGPYLVVQQQKREVRREKMRSIGVKR